MRIPPVDRVVQLLQQIETLCSHATEYAAAILLTGAARYQPFSFEAVDEPRHAWSVLNHALADRKRRESVGSGAAEYTQHVVLLWRDAVGLDDLSETAFHGIGGAEEAECGLLFA